MSRELPILFSTPMVRAILDGTKSCTRRVMKPQPPEGFPFPCIKDVNGRTVCTWSADKAGDFPMWRAHVNVPYQVGDVLYVKEAHYRYGHWVRNGVTRTGRQKWVFHAVAGQVRFMDNPPDAVCKASDKTAIGWFKRPSLFLPKELARIWLRVTDVRGQRIQEISERDAIAEGTQLPIAFMPKVCQQAAWSERQVFQRLWDHLNAKRGYSWDSNPWCWVYAFKVMQHVP